MPSVRRFSPKNPGGSGRPSSASQETVVDPEIGLHVRAHAVSADPHPAVERALVDRRHAIAPAVGVQLRDGADGYEARHSVIL